MSSHEDPADTIGTRWQAIAGPVLVLALVGLGLFVLSGFLRALVWALVLAVALWPLFARARRRVPATILAAVFTSLAAIVVLLPLAFLTLEAAREARDLLAYAKSIEQTGIPVPDFVAHLPFGSQALAAWWNAHLAHAGWAQEAIAYLDTASNREFTRHLGAGLVHRVVLFSVCLLCLFFLLRDGEALIGQSLTASHRLFGPRGERIARQMVASVHGTVAGLVLVGLGEGAVLGVVYWFAGVPHPVLLGAFTAVAAILPFGAAVAFGTAAALLLAKGALVPALVVVAAGLLVVFAADHLVRPALIGGSTKLPFLWVLLGILGGVETLGLLGLFVGPAVMAALVLLWRDFVLGEDVNEGPPPRSLPPSTSS